MSDSPDQCAAGWLRLRMETRRRHIDFTSPRIAGLDRNHAPGLLANEMPVRAPVGGGRCSYSQSKSAGHDPAVKTPG